MKKLCILVLASLVMLNAQEVAKPKTKQKTGRVAFWTPIKTGWNAIHINVGGTYYGRLITFAEEQPPKLGNSDTITVTLPVGTYSYTAKGDNGMLWKGKVSIREGNYKTVELNGKNNLNKGDVVFWTTKRTPGTLKWYIDDVHVNNVLPQYIRKSKEPKCGEKYTVTSKGSPIGLHTYKFKYGSTVVFSGTFITIKGKCTAVKVD